MLTCQIWRAAELAAQDIAAQPPADPVEMKTVYVKRWRTLVNLPAKYADEIVEALRPHEQCSAVTAGGLLSCPLCRSTQLRRGVTYGYGSSEKRDAVMCLDCGCRATEAAWQGRDAVPQTLRESFEKVITALQYDGSDTDSLTVGEIRRALP
jgi:hypothetical protein